MFNKNFYPTPEEVIGKMVEGLHISGKTILEPSAGKGDILKYIETKTFNHEYRGRVKTYNNTNLLCIEKDLQLQSILRDKEYKIIGSDFLEYNSDYSIDIILMNPPFDNGIKHLFKAWEISDNGTEIRCLLNAETINNPHTKERRLLIDILNDNDGEVEYLGNCFANAERKTNVEVVLVKLKNDIKKDKFKINFKTEAEKHIKFEEIEGSQLAKTDVLQNLEDKYNGSKEVVAEYLRAKEKLKFYLDGVIDSKDINDILKDSSESDPKKSFNKINEKIRRKFWNYIFTKTKIEEKCTSDVAKDFRNFKSNQYTMGFTVSNIKSLLESLLFNQDKIFIKCIEDGFDYLTKFHKENRVHPEGWKTNGQFIVNKKFILPSMRSWSDIKWGSAPNIDYTSRDKIRDLEKSLCFIIKKDIKSIVTIQDKFSEGNIQFGKWSESTFFKFKMFKKGTMHFEFRDENIWNQFNQIACKNKNWLGYN